MGNKEKNNISLLEVFKEFFMIGCQLIGGGYVIIPLLQKSVVEKRQWITTEDLVKYISLGKCLPGIIAINVSMFVGNKLKGISGAATATIAIILPPLIAIFFIIRIFNLLISNNIVQTCFWGMKAGVLVLIYFAVEELYKNSKKDLKFHIIFSVILLLVLFSKISPALIILASCIFGGIYPLINKEDNKC